MRELASSELHLVSGGVGTVPKNNAPSNPRVRIPQPHVSGDPDRDNDNDLSLPPNYGLQLLSDPNSTPHGTNAVSVEG